MNRAYRLFAETERKILSGEYGCSGARMPTVRDFAKEQICSFRCAMEVYGRLVEGNLLHRVGNKYFVTTGRCAPCSEYGKELSNCQHKAFGALIRDSSNPFFALLMQKLQESLGREGMDLVISASNGEPLRESHIMNLFLDMKCQGVFVCVPLNELLRNILEHYPLPVVVLAEECDLAGISSVTVDNFAAGEQVAKHLLMSGCCSFAYVTVDDYLDTDLRLKGYTKFLSSNSVADGDIAITVVSGTDENLRKTKISGFVRELYKRVNSNCLPIGVFCVHDLLALEIMRAIHLEGIGRNAELRIPEDIKIVGFDDLPQASIVSVPITSVSYPYSSMAEAALIQMKQYLRDINAVPVDSMVDCHLVIRRSSN